MRNTNPILLLLASLTLAACSSRGPAPTGPVLQPPARPDIERAGAPGTAREGEAALAPFRVVESRTERPIELAELGERVAGAEVVFFGELHNDPGTHQLQLALLEEISRHTDRVILSLEMVERDVQPLLDAYLAGRITESEFLAESRPWSNYATDYRPLVEFARERGWPVLAANVPRPIAAQVSRGGLDTLQALPTGERAFVATEARCPRDAYYARFVEAMGEHPGFDDAMVMRFYEAQCIKDETMAESIVAALEAHPGSLIVHMNGSFHSDFGQGVPERVARRRPGTRMLILTGLPVEDPGVATGAGELERADFLIYTKRPDS